MRVKILTGLIALIASAASAPAYAHASCLHPNRHHGISPAPEVGFFVSENEEYFTSNNEAGCLNVFIHNSFIPAVPGEWEVTRASGIQPSLWPLPPEGGVWCVALYEPERDPAEERLSPEFCVEPLPEERLGHP